MIPVAGDSLTDIIVQHCLVDFDTAERIKRQTGTQESVEYQDIMGLTQVITAKEVESILAEHVPMGSNVRFATCSPASPTARADHSSGEGAVGGRLEQETDGSVHCCCRTGAAHSYNACGAGI